MNILPHAFAERMKYHIGSDSGNIFAAMKRMPIRGLRMNPMKTSENHSILVFMTGRYAMPWTSDGRFLSFESAAGIPPLHACGAYYLQKPSAMLPADDIKIGF